MKIEYNINGIGNIETEIHGYSKKMYEDINLQVEKKLKSINQLGAIKYIHPGAHYTRYEYFILQSKLLNILKENKGNILGLTTNVKFKKFNFSSSNLKISGSDLITFIFLCTNYGHFSDTFTANKVWFDYVKKNKMKMFNNLNKDEKLIFERIIKEGDYYKIHWLNTTQYFIKNKNIDLRELWTFSMNILLSKERNLYKDIYNKIRSITYISLDSNFSLSPINVDLQSLLLNKEYFIDEIGSYNSEMMAIFSRMNSLLEDSLYMDNNVTITSTLISQELYKNVDKYIKSKKQQTYKLLFDKKSPLNNEFDYGSEIIKWNKNKNLSITIKNTGNLIIENMFNTERTIKKKLNAEIHFGLSKNPENTKFRMVYSIDNSSIKLRNVTKIIKVSINQLIEINNKFGINVFEDKILKKHITFLIRNILDDDYYCEYDDKKMDNMILFCSGKNKTMLNIEQKIKEYREVYPDNADSLHELKSIHKVIDEMNYKGNFIVYLGSLVLYNNKREPVCEIDGLIYLPNKVNPKLIVVEAKNKKRTKKYSESIEQLEQGFKNLLIENEDILDLNITNVNGFGAKLVVEFK